MANNRLYIVNPETGEKFCLAKSFGDGWQTWHGSPEILEQQLNGFFDGADVEASVGNPSQMKPTKLYMTTENEE